MKRQLVCGDEAVRALKQHKKPCADCPFSPKSLRGWLGSMTAGEWIHAVHGEALIDCHTTDKQCAGAAIYRANVFKPTIDKKILRLPANRNLAFRTPMEFMKHHSIKGFSK